MDNFSSLLRSKPHFQPEMLRPEKATTTMLFQSSVLLLMRTAMKKEVQKEVFFIEKLHSKV